MFNAYLSHAAEGIKKGKGQGRKSYQQGKGSGKAKIRQAKAKIRQAIGVIALHKRFNTSNLLNDLAPVYDLEAVSA